MHRENKNIWLHLALIDGYIGYAFASLVILASLTNLGRAVALLWGCSKYCRHYNVLYMQPFLLTVVAF